MAAQSHFHLFRPLMGSRGAGETRSNRVDRVCLVRNMSSDQSGRLAGGSGSRALVTGASGFLGARLCKELLKQGYSVKAFDLQTSDISSLTSAAADDSLQIVYGDVTDYASLLDAVTDCHVIFHAAAVVEHWLPDPSTFYSVNVGGLKNVVKAYKETNTVEKIIYTSSFFALGSTEGHVGDETKVHDGKYFTMEYEKSKMIADTIALDAAAEGVPLVPVYPGVIYGPGSAKNMITKLVVQRFNGLIPGYFGKDNNMASFCYIDDVVKGHIAALTKGRPGQRYLLTGENVSFKHFFDVAAEITRTPKPQFRIPLIIMETVAWLCLIFTTITRKPPLITPSAVNFLSHDWAYSCEKAKKELDYNPRSLREGLREMLPWLKSLGLIKY